MIFRDFDKMSSNIIYTLCYKERAIVLINWRSLNSATTKHNMFQVNSKNIECELLKISN